MAWPKIAEARKAKGWSQQDLADRLGVAQSNVARMETTDVDIKASTLMNLSSTLGVTISYILGYGFDDSDLVESDPSTFELIRLYNAMDQPSRDALMLVARGLVCGSQGPKHEH